MTLYVRRFVGVEPPDPGGGGGGPDDITFTTPPASTTITEGGAATFSWVATSPSGAALSFTIQTEDPAGVGSDGTGWWNFGTQSATTYTFPNVLLSDNGTIVRIIAANGVDTSATAYATITVDPGSGTPPGATFTDAFTRANSTNIASGAPVSWTEYEFSGDADVDWKIVSNTLRIDADEYGGALAGSAGGADHYSECVVSGITGTSQILGPAVRCSSTFDQGFMAIALDGYIRLYRANNTYSPAVVTDSSACVTTGGEHTIRMEAEGTTIRVYCDTVLVLTTTVSAYLTNTYVGVAGNGSVGTAAYIDSYTGGLLGTSPPPPGGGGELTLGKVFFAGHSLMKEYVVNPFSLDNLAGDTLHTPSYIATAMAGAGLTINSDKLIGLSGATVYSLHTAIDANSAEWSDCDTMVIDCIINGDETAAQFKTEAETMITGIRAVVADMKIVFMEGHAHPTLASANTNSRWAAKNPKLYEMLAAGKIDGIIPWAAFAAANPIVYTRTGSPFTPDGVHHRDQKEYADQMVTHLVRMSAPAPPDPGSGGITSRQMGFDNYSPSHFGQPFGMTGPGNIQMKAVQVAMPFKAVTSASITHASFIIKYNSNNPGYSGPVGSMGVLRAHIYAATADGSPTGSSLGQFTLNSVIAPDGNVDNGHVGKWAFDSAVPVVQGNAYALVIQNVASNPAASYFSLNMMVENPMSTGLQPDFAYQDISSGNGFFFPRYKGADSYWNPNGNANAWTSYYRTSHWLNWHLPCMEIYFGTGVRQGQAYVGGTYGNAVWERQPLAAGVRIRMSALSKRGGRTAQYVNYRSGFHGQTWPTGTTYGFILRSAGGTQLATATISKNGNWWGRGQLSTPVAIADNTVYLFDFYHLSGTTMNYRAIQTSLNRHGWDADGQSNLPGGSSSPNVYAGAPPYVGGSQISTDGGSTWSGIEYAYSNALFLETTV